MRTCWLVLLAAFALAVACCGEKSAEPPDTQKAAVRFDDPKELGKAFMDAVFKDPGAAYSLCEDAYRDSVSEDQFRSGLTMMLPPADTIEAVKFLAFEDGFQESDGTTSCSCAYEVLSSDEFQRRCEVGVAEQDVQAVRCARRASAGSSARTEGWRWVAEADWPGPGGGG